MNNNIIAKHFNKGAFFQLVKDGDGYWAQISYDGVDYGDIVEGYCGADEAEAVEYFNNRW